MMLEITCPCGAQWRMEDDEAERRRVTLLAEALAFLAQHQAHVHTPDANELWED